MSDALLQLTGVTKTFGGIHALSGMVCEVPEGKIVGVIGPNGAGKTTLFNTITGAYRADAGEVKLKGVDVTQWPSYRIVREGIARTFQNIRLFGSMTVWEHLLVAQPHSESAWRRLLPISWANPAAQERAEEVMAFFGLTELRDRPAKHRRTAFVNRTRPSWVSRRRAEGDRTHENRHGGDQAVQAGRGARCADRGRRARPHGHGS